MAAPAQRGLANRSLLIVRFVGQAVLAYCLLGTQRTTDNCASDKRLA